jgi:hypothetical protein
MRKINQIIAQIGCSFVLLLALQLPDAALAHEGSARIELNTQQTSSGAELEIRGINIAPEQPVTLSLVGNAADFALGMAVGDVHGDFVVGVRLPAEAPAGTYTVRAFGANRVIVTAPLTLLGSAAEEESAQRDQDEPLLAPMPRAQPASPVVAVVPPVAAAPAAVQGSQLGFWLAVVLAVIAAVVALIIGMRRWSRSSNMPFHGDTPAQ